MTNSLGDGSPLKNAKIAGGLYLAIALFGIFSIGYMPSVVFVFGDAGATAQSIEANMGIFRLGIFADILVILCEIGLTALLFGLLKPVSNFLSLMAALARMGMIVVMGMNLINYLIPLLLLSHASYLSSFSGEQLAVLAMVFLDAHELGVYVWQIFFSLHLLVLGYLVYRAQYFPKFPGILMMVGSFGYLVQSLEKLTLTSNGLISAIGIGLLIFTVGEIVFGLWLLIKGVDMNNWEKTQSM